MIIYPCLSMVIAGTFSAPSSNPKPRIKKKTPSHFQDLEKIAGPFQHLAQVQNPGSKKNSKIPHPRSRKNCWHFSAPSSSPKPRIQKKTQKSRSHNSKVQTSKSKIQKPQPKLQSPNLEIQNPEATTKTPKSKPRNPKSRIQNHNSKVQTSKSKIQNPKSQLQSPNLEIQDPESKIKTPNSKPQKPRSFMDLMDLMFWMNSSIWISCSCGLLPGV